MTFDDQLHASLERMVAGVRAPLEAELRVYAEEMDRTAARAAERAAAAAAAAAAEALSQTEAQLAALREKTAEEFSAAREAAERQLAAVRSEALAEVDEARRDAQAQIADAQRMLDERLTELTERSGALEDARREIEGTRRELEDTRRELEAARREAAEARTRADEFEQARLSVVADLQDVQRASSDQIAAAGRELDDARRALEDTRREIEELRAQIAAAADERVEAVSRAIRESRNEELTRLHQLVAAAAALDAASSIGEVLDRLAEHSAREADRTAVLVVRQGRLREWQLVGFSANAPRERGSDLPLDEPGLIAAAVRTGRAARRVGAAHLDDGTAASPPFASDAGLRDAAAIPVIVGRAVVAVVYADAPPQEPAEGLRWPWALEMLARHASHVLETMTVQQAAGLWTGRAVARASQTASGGHPLTGSAQ